MPRIEITGYGSQHLIWIAKATVDAMFHEASLLVTVVLVYSLRFDKVVNLYRNDNIQQLLIYLPNYRPAIVVSRQARQSDDDSGNSETGNKDRSLPVRVELELLSVSACATFAPRGFY